MFTLISPGSWTDTHVMFVTSRTPFVTMVTVIIYEDCVLFCHTPVLFLRTKEWRKILTWNLTYRCNTKIKHLFWGSFSRRTFFFFSGSRDIAVGIVTGWMTQVRFLAWQDFSLLHSVQTRFWGAHLAFYPMGSGGGVDFLGVKAIRA
jgi:hypothetical protein